MEIIDKKLTAVAVAILVVAAFILLLFETDVFEEGILYNPKSSMQFMSEWVCMALILCIPVALRLMLFNHVRKSLKTNPSNYFLWASLRMLIMGVILWFGILVHYLYMSPNVVFCPVVTLLAFVFVWPTSGRREKELESA